ENVVLREGGLGLAFALDDRDARLATHGTRELHDDGVRLRGDAPHRAAREASAAGRALHRADPLQDGPDPIHAGQDCTTDATATHARSSGDRARPRASPARPTGR